MGRPGELCDLHSCLFRGTMEWEEDPPKLALCDIPAEKLTLG